MQKMFFYLVGNTWMSFHTDDKGFRVQLCKCVLAVLGVTNETAAYSLRIRTTRRAGFMKLSLKRSYGLWNWSMAEAPVDMGLNCFLGMAVDGYLDSLFGNVPDTEAVLWVKFTEIPAK